MINPKKLGLSPALHQSNYTFLVHAWASGGGSASADY